MFDIKHVSKTVIENVNFPRDETNMATASSKLDVERVQVLFKQTERPLAAFMGI